MADNRDQEEGEQSLICLDKIGLGDNKQQAHNINGKRGFQKHSSGNFDLLSKTHALMQSSNFCIFRFVAEERGQ
uniref:Uncharacterized protein n=1 Tax=Romanomermis culicivorax TaxID=13658 RepID=A0A915I1I0_ROMCU